MPDPNLNWWSVVLVGRGEPIDSIAVTYKRQESGVAWLVVQGPDADPRLQ